MCPIIGSRMHLAGRHKARDSAGGGHRGGMYPRSEGGVRIAGWHEAGKVAEEARIMEKPRNIDINERWCECACVFNKVNVPDKKTL